MIGLAPLRHGRRPFPRLASLPAADNEIAPPSTTAGPSAGQADDDIRDAAGRGAGGRCPQVVLIVTGMGMRGDVENDLRDRVRQMFSPPVPVLVHRYGVARSGSLFRPCQQAATRRLSARLRELSAAGDAQSGPPDVIAHSFGAWLVGQALRQNPDIRVGRIIMAGSVLRPDYDWRTIMAGAQAEAVLNHYGSRDLWAFVSEFFIPDSGPAGFKGFAECSGVFNRPEPGFRHLTFFQSGHIDTVHRTLWRPFLTWPAEELPSLAGPDISRLWRPRSWLLRANLLRALLLACLAAGTADLLLSAVRLVTGLLS
jgi:pimeloyl-ACP methyl ester carboxylesterase